jgi:hypothetical protein
MDPLTHLDCLDTEIAEVLNLVLDSWSANDLLVLTCRMANISLLTWWCDVCCDKKGHSNYFLTTLVTLADVWILV